MTGGQNYWESRAEPSQPADSGDIDPFLLDVPTADPATLPVFTLEPADIRALRDHADPITAHRTRRNTR